MRPARQLKSVVLPAPFGPIRPAMSPRSTSNETPSTAVCRRNASGDRRAVSMAPSESGARLGLCCRTTCGRLSPHIRSSRLSKRNRAIALGRDPFPTARRQLRTLRPQGRGRGAGGRDDLLRRQARRSFRAARARCCTCRRARASRSIRWRRVLPLLPAKQRPTDPNDWMTTDAEVACPDPELPDPVPHHAHRPAPLPPRRDDGRAAAAAGATRDERVETRRACARATRSRGSSAAAGSSPAATAPVDGEPAVADMRPSSMPASPPSIAPTSIPASRS